MPSILPFGKNKQEIELLVKQAGFSVVGGKPQFVASYGGDGTLMRAEDAYPGVPKIILRNSAICKKCSVFPNEEVLQKVKKKKYSVEKLIKLEARAGKQTLLAVNDIVIHNADPRHAIRYFLSVNGKAIGETIIGDGVVVATPFGGTGYYRSITDSFFEVGLGLAFNNSIEPSDHMVLKEDAVIKIKIIRGPAVLYADNQEKKIILDEGSEVTIKKSNQKALFVIPGATK